MIGKRLENVRKFKYVIHGTGIHIGEGGARLVSGGLRYLNLHFLVQGSGNRAELCG